jgi:D-alanyl-D-alanine carboxypeptidase/D-alanyl-D-alanine-endopeptidase (penicillin-binding protein 4)
MLSQITGMALRYNDNFIADMLMKTIGAKQTGGVGTFNAGVDAVDGFLTKRHINDWEPLIRDGSGLSRSNSAPANLITAVLQYVVRQNYGPDYEKSFAAPGQPGVLQNWFVALRNSKGGNDMAKRIQAIHGAYAGAYDMSGYAVSAAGQKFVFTFMINDPDMKPEHARQLFERLTEVLVRSKAVGKGK